MPKQGKKFEAASKQVESRPYNLSEAVPLVQKIKFAKFDETVELHLRLGVDPKHADQMVRGTIVLPNGLGKSKKVLVIASGDKQREAREAGADIVGGDEIVARIQRVQPLFKVRQHRFIAGIFALLYEVSNHI